jgi:hypothetical protein
MMKGARGSTPHSSPPSAAAGVMVRLRTILVDRVEEVFRGAEEPDDARARAERFEILRQVPLPQLLAEAEQEDDGRHDDDVALKAEVLRHAPAPPALGGSPGLSVARRSHLRAVLILFGLLREEVANQLLLFLVFDAREEFRAELADRLGAVEGQALVHRASREVAGRAL